MPPASEPVAVQEKGRRLDEERNSVLKIGDPDQRHASFAHVVDVPLCARRKTPYPWALEAVQSVKEKKQVLSPAYAMGHPHHLSPGPGCRIVGGHTKPSWLWDANA